MKISTISINSMGSDNSLIQNYGANIEMDSNTKQMA
jgi:hypothetical protein